MKKVPIALLATFLAISPVFIGCKSKKAETNKTTDQPATTDNQPAVEPVVTSTDDELTRSVTDALKDHPSVHYSLDNGKIVLTGEIERAKWIALKQQLDQLKSKGYELSGLKIK